jgi:curved DNA-binding protein CbpA
MYKFFVPTPATLDELKKQYRKLAMLHHPDRGGNLDTMKAINNEHDALFEVLKTDQNRRADADTTGRTKHTTETAEEFRDILEILLHLDGLEVELCGCWLWISGDTKANKDALKAAGCRWSNGKKMWYWRHPEDAQRYHKGHKYSIDDIRTKYGSQIFTAGDAQLA